MPDTEQKDRMGRVAVAAVISVLVASGFWNILYQFMTRDMVSRGEVRVMIEQSGPYVEDRKMIYQKLSDLNDGQREILYKIEEMRGEAITRRKTKR